MARVVPLARRNLFTERRRLVASAAGVGLALMLILLLDGLWAGIDTKTTVYEDHVGADLYVAAPGTRNFFSAASVLPISMLDEIRADPDVTWAAPARGVFSITQLHEDKVPTYLIGWEPGQPGGPWNIADGKEPDGPDEVAVGEALATRHGVDVGERIDILGHAFTVTGIAAGADMFMASFVFMTHGTADALLGSPDTTSFVLVGTPRPDAVRERLARSGAAVLTRDELKAADLAVMTRAFAVPIKVMVAVAFTVGVLVIALTTYSAIVEHQRDYGIFKALGADRTRLYRVAIQQTVILAGAGLAAGTLFYLLGRELIGWARPQFSIVLTVAIVGRAIAAALIMGLVAAVVPARRLARLDPATAYRGG